MAKNKNRSGRDDPLTSLIQPLPRPSPTIVVAPSNYTTLLEVQDNRAYYPEDTRPALDIAGRPHTLQYPSPKKTKLNKDRFAYLRAFPSSRVQFTNSQNVLLCIRRKRRKEVLHALKKTGRGKGKQRRPRRSRYSSISC